MHAIIQLAGKGRYFLTGKLTQLYVYAAQTTGTFGRLRIASRDWVVQSIGGRAKAGVVAPVQLN